MTANTVRLIVTFQSIKSKLFASVQSFSFKTFSIYFNMVCCVLFSSDAIFIYCNIYFDPVVLVLFVLNIFLDGNLYGRNIHGKVVRQIITAS